MFWLMILVCSARIRFKNKDGIKCIVTNRLDRIYFSLIVMCLLFRLERSHAFKMFFVLPPMGFQTQHHLGEHLRCHDNPCFGGCKHHVANISSTIFYNSSFLWFVIFDGCYCLVRFKNYLFAVTFVASFTFFVAKFVGSNQRLKCWCC